MPVLALLVGSYVFGFSLVYSFYHPVEPAEPGESPAVEAVPVAPAPDQVEADTAPASAVDIDTVRNEEGEAPPEVPPGRVPDGVSIEKAPLYLKCWDSGGTLYKFPACDSLRILEKRLASRLYVVNKCKARHSGEDSEGILSLGVQVDFDEKSVSFWSGPSSNLENAAQVGTCVRGELAEGFPIHGVDHKLSKYRIFFTVEFRDPEELQKELAKKRKRGRTVDVTKDHVRVRKEPLDGFIIGKISSDSQVTLVGRQNDWCHVITPNDNEGWMICDALAL